MNKNTDRLEFDGAGFDRSDFTETERAAMRERNHHYDRHFLSADEFLADIGLTWLSRASKGFVPFIKAFAAVGTIGSAVVVAQQLGWIG